MAEDGSQGAPPIEERGSFSHGVCRVCGWSGPARRSRRVARGDAAGHVADCPEAVVLDDGSGGPL